MDYQNVVITPEPTDNLQVPASTDTDGPMSQALHSSDIPLVTIAPGKKSLGLNFRELWRYRELLFFLMWRDIKVRYKQTALGATWAVMQPLLLMAIFTFIFSRLGGIQSEKVPYPIFAYVALLPWTFFANAVTNSGNSLIVSANLITKVYFPRVIIPAAAVCAGLVDFGIAFLMLIVLMFYYHIGVHPGVLLLPVFIFLMMLLALGVGMLMAALNVKYRDVRHALPFLIQVWMFASPIMYPVPKRSGWIFALNPMTGIIKGFRWSLLANSFDWFSIITATIMIVLFLAFGVFTFKRMEKSFADVI